MRKASFLAIVLFLAVCVPAWADDVELLDPAVLHVGSGAGTPCATGGCPVYSGEVNPFGSTLDIYFNPNQGSQTLYNPVLLIFGVPNDLTSGTLLNLASITSVTLYDSYPGGGTSSVPYSFGTTAYGLNGSGFQTWMLSGDVYGVLGLTANNSNSFTNWANWDNAVNGIDASNFGIYVFALNTDAFSGHDLLNVVTTGIPTGTFAVAWGRSSDHAYATAFTEAGLTTTTVPEPGSLALLGSGLLGLVGMIRRKFSSW